LTKSAADELGSHDPAREGAHQFGGAFVGRLNGAEPFGGDLSSPMITGIGTEPGHSVRRSPSTRPVRQLGQYQVQPWRAGSHGAAASSPAR
jgi:hypothetical protein